MSLDGWNCIVFGKTVSCKCTSAACGRWRTMPNTSANCSASPMSRCCSWGTCPATWPRPAALPTSPASAGATLRALQCHASSSAELAAAGAVLGAAGAAQPRTVPPPMRTQRAYTMQAERFLNGTPPCPCMASRSSLSTALASSGRSPACL